MSRLDHFSQGRWPAVWSGSRGGRARLLIAVRQPGKFADPIADAMMKILAFLPPQWRQTITFDNGTDFARHYRLHALGMDILLRHRLTLAKRRS